MNFYQYLSPSLKETYIDLLEIGWEISLTDNKRGQCTAKGKERKITVPVWAIAKNSKEPGFLDWYAAHEFSHAFDYMNRKTMDHGPAFMDLLKKICPASCIHFELTYMTKGAIAAGITPNLDDL